ncbi:MAG: CRISPR-associated protein Cas4 [Candidatus Kapaibacteriota bacterium]
MKITGTHISYFFHCERHLWLFSNSIHMEHTSDTVAMGSFISESTYERQKHEIHYEDENFEISLDFFDTTNNIIHEVKKSNKMEETHIWQVRFYIYVLEAVGFKNVSGEIDYPLLKQKVSVELSEKEKIRLIDYIEKIKEIIIAAEPPKIINMPFCKSCSYYEFCYI